MTEGLRSACEGASRTRASFAIGRAATSGLRSTVSLMTAGSIRTSPACLYCG